MKVGVFLMILFCTSWFSLCSEMESENKEAYTIIEQEPKERIELNYYFDERGDIVSKKERNEKKFEAPKSHIEIGIKTAILPYWGFSSLGEKKRGVYYTLGEALLISSITYYFIKADENTPLSKHMFTAMITYDLLKIIEQIDVHLLTSKYNRKKYEIYKNELKNKGE